MTGMRDNTVMTEKKTQVEEEEEQEETIVLIEIVMTEIVMIEMTEAPETIEMTDMKDMIDMTEVIEEMIALEMTEMKENMKEMEDMTVGTADQETALEDTARRLGAKENLLQVYPWLLGIPLPKKMHSRKEMSLPKEDSGHTP